MKLADRGQFAIVLATPALAACAPAMVNQQTEEQSVRYFSTEWQHAIAARDVDRVYAIFAPDAVMMTSHNPLATGATTLRALVRGMLGTPGLSLTWVPTRVEVASPSLATEYGTYTLSYDGPQGKVNDAGNYTNIWRKTNRQWRVLLHAAVTSMPRG
jgi:uncharacterized protein (TIGR02246 family)